MSSFEQSSVSMVQSTLAIVNLLWALCVEDNSLQIGSIRLQSNLNEKSSL